MACPRCNAEPGEVCEVLSADGLEIVPVERIRAEAAIDLSAKERSLQRDSGHFFFLRSVLSLAPAAGRFSFL